MLLLQGHQNSKQVYSQQQQSRGSSGYLQAMPHRKDTRSAKKTPGKVRTRVAYDLHYMQRTHASQRNDRDFGYLQGLQKQGCKREICNDLNFKIKAEMSPAAGSCRALEVPLAPCTKTCVSPADGEDEDSKDDDGVLLGAPTSNGLTCCWSFCCLATQ